MVRVASVADGVGGQDRDNLTGGISGTFSLRGGESVSYGGDLPEGTCHLRGHEGGELVTGAAPREVDGTVVSLGIGRYPSIAGRSLLHGKLVMDELAAIRVRARDDA